MSDLGEDEIFFSKSGVHLSPPKLGRREGGEEDSGKKPLFPARQFSICLASCGIAPKVAFFYMIFFPQNGSGSPGQKIRLPQISRVL